MFATVANLMMALRLLSFVLAFAIITHWFSSFWRVLKRRQHERDAQRAIWVPMAGAIILFQVRSLYPGFGDMTRMGIWFFAQAATIGALLWAIYHHGKSEPGFDARKVAVVHSLMLVGSVWFVATFR